MSGSKLKQGYMKKFAKGIIGESWKKVFVELYNDGLFCWYKKKKSSSRKGSVLLPVICEYLTVGSYCRAIPFSPQLPSGGKLDYMIAFPEEPNKRSKIHFFLCENEREFSEWMNVITSTFPPAPVVPQQQQQPPPQQTTCGTGPYSSAYSPMPSVAATAPSVPQNSAAPIIGFEGLNVSNNPPPYSAQPPAGYSSPHQPPYPQPAYPPPQQSYPQQPYPQQPYPQQPNPQQPYYPRQQNPYGQQYPQYQPYGASTVPQTVVADDRHRSRGSSGLRNLATGALGGAVAGYAASRLFGGWGHGFGWGGHGSWGSGSWGSGSWGSCSGGSWGSFD